MVGAGSIPRASLAIVAAVLVSLVAACSTSSGDAVACAPDDATSERSRPNIVVVLTDDQTVEQVRVMPNVIELATSGTVFANSVVNYSNCCPSRATLLTGQQANHHGVLWNSPPTGGYQAFHDHETALPASLQAAGYETILIGKLLNRYGELELDRVVPPGWSDFKALVFPTETAYYESAFIDNGDLVETGPDDYVTDVITDHALDAIDRMADSDRPFFMLLGHVAPHGTGGIALDDVVDGMLDAQIAATYPRLLTPPRVPAERLARLADEDLPVSSAFNEVDVDDKPDALRRRRLDGSEIGEIVRNYRAELASLELVDESVGAVRQRLRDHCIDDETVIIVTSDNGFMHGEHRLIGGKYFAYEPSIRVPLIVSGPGVSPGVERSLASNVDLAPTIADLAGASLLMPSDGRSLVPLLDGGSGASWGRAVYVEGHAPGDDPLRPTFDGVHTGDTLYVEYSDGSRELYDMRTDPDQLENLASAPSAVDVLDRHRELLQQLRDCVGALCASIGTELPVPETPDVGWLAPGDG